MRDMTLTSYDKEVKVIDGAETAPSRKGEWPSNKWGWTRDLVADPPALLVASSASDERQLER